MKFSNNNDTEPNKSEINIYQFPKQKNWEMQIFRDYFI